MAFEEVEIIANASASASTGVSVGLAKMRSSKAKLRITIRAEAFQQMGFTVADRFALLVGSGEHHGIIRLRKDKSGKVKATERCFTGGVTAFQLSLGHRHEFVDRTEKAVPCQWEKIDFTTVEIILPPWADETGPRKAVRIQTKPSTLLAGERDQLRQASERQEADQRRAQNSLADLEAEALRQVQAVMTSQVRMFSPSLGITKAEADILRILIERKGAYVTREQLDTVLNMHRPNETPAPKVFDVHISKIRAKLPDPGMIATLHGQGWRFVGSPETLYEEVAA